MTLLDATTPVAVTAVPTGRTPQPARASWLVRHLGEAWPLKVLLLGFPIWWAAGLASFACQLVAIPMTVQIVRRARARGGLRVPVGFGFWVLFLGWMLLGITTLWSLAPGTEANVGASKLVGFFFRVGWYLTVTVAMLYPLSLGSRRVSSMDVARWLGNLFLVCVIGGVAGLLLPTLQFTSLTEYVIPGARNANGFVHTLVHPSLTTYSDFLGYSQPRPKAPFLYANAWGNNLALTMPFFVYSWLSAPQRWRRFAVAPVLVVAAAPIAYSLNRGLWGALVLITVLAAAALARAGRFGALYGLVVALLISMIVLVASPLWATITLRYNTPHSNARRATVAQTVIETTAFGSPLLGFGSTRIVQGNFASIAGTGTSACQNCAAPPLGTQGFIWRLILTTGFVGTALYLLFMGAQMARHVSRRTPFAVLGAITLMTSLLLSFVYDSLESPLFITMIAVGLMNRERLEEQDEREAQAEVMAEAESALDTNPGVRPAGGRQ